VKILFWFRKDLRLDDNTGLAAAMRDAEGNVVPFFASDPAMLKRPDIASTRVRYVLESLAELAVDIERTGSHLAFDHGDPAPTVLRAANACGANAVYWNDEYEPFLIARDAAVERALTENNIKVRRFHDRLLVPPGAVLNKAGQPFVVYTPFRKACEAVPIAAPVPPPHRLEPHHLPRRMLATLERIGFRPPESERWPGGTRAAHARLARFVEGGLARYATHRDMPAEPAVSRLSPDLKFGTLSVRTILQAVLLAAQADPALQTSAEKYLWELRWRDFYAHVLYHFPHCEHGAFRREYDAIRWQGNPAHAERWMKGQTGVPIVDAGMRELLATGFMHNRVRMLVASFLTKDLLLDWKIGERHFMRHLIDGDIASNNGGWQWAAGTGTDAQPYFRIFNPVLQGQKFDREGAYVRRWVPELARMPDNLVHEPWNATPRALADAGVTLGGNYPAPLVDHAAQRERALAMYKAVAAMKPAAVTS
jgi:deoxyribodipyrimidine photo-lyase